MRRRDLLSLLGGSLLLPGLGVRGAFAAATGGTRPPRGARLVLIELAGANDGLNTLVPWRDDHYRAARPTLALAGDALIARDDAFGLHPALAPLLDAREAGELAFVHGLGYPRPNRSHFRSIGLWERGGDGIADARGAGWMTHAIEHDLAPRVPDVHGMSLAGGPSLFASDGGRWLSAGSVAQLLTHAAAPPATGSIDAPLVRRIAARLETLDATLAGIGARLDAVPDEPPLAGAELGEQFRQVARLVRAGIDVPLYRVRLDGFDTHERQARRHAERLGTLAAAVGAFRERLIALGEWRSTVLVTYSEFGRRAAENASGGTDHGTAAPHLVLGGRVRGGLYGEAPDLAPAALRDGDPVHTMDYRALYTRVLDGALGVRDARLASYRDERLAALIG